MAFSLDRVAVVVGAQPNTHKIATATVSERKPLPRRKGSGDGFIGCAKIDLVTIPLAEVVLNRLLVRAPG